MSIDLEGTGTERDPLVFDDYSLASEFCRKRERPVVVSVDDEITRIYPSGKFEPVNYQLEGAAT